jgi:CHASE3 domain sensor protein
MEMLIIIAVLIVGLGLMFLYLARMLNELHLSLNSRLDLLLAKTDQLARAEGYKAGQESDWKN